MSDTAGSFDEFWTRASGHDEPFPYQRRLGTRDWPELVSVPTGLGKTAAVGLSWIYRRTNGCSDTPRRLVYCLPMRVLVEQTADAFRTWLANLDLLGEPGVGKVSVSVLMGGEPGLRQASWARHPEEDAVLIGTQDMLLSRALMRGYGMSRYQWPVHFALLHNDALWVFDEVQLMGPALATSAQLEGFRRRSRGALPSRSLWLSATLREEWLRTVDLRSHAEALGKLEIDDADREKAADRLGAVKRLHRADVVLDRESRKDGYRSYLEGLSTAVLDHHEDGEQTLVILNRVDRAQALAKLLRSQSGDTRILLVHARFRAAERSEINHALHDDPGAAGRIIVATQAVEAGVDLSSRTLVTELAPWSSLVQRFGRCNRRGEHEVADVYWIDIADEAGESLPYDDPELEHARQTLEGLSRVGPAGLPAVPADRPLGQVIRWKDLVDLFDTDSDLSGFDVDVAPYIRDQGMPQIRVYWRSFEDRPDPNECRPTLEELCPVSLGQLQKYLKSKVKRRTRTCWLWDPLVESWDPRKGRSRIVPGSTVLLRAEDGGYDSFLGFDPISRTEVPTIAIVDRGENDADRDDPSSRGGRFVPLVDHLIHVAEEMKGLSSVLRIPEREAKALEAAAIRHDVGKAHPAFQTAILDFAGEDETLKETLWAKSGGRGRLRYRVEVGETVSERRHFRHELASMLAWLAHVGDHKDRDLVAYLILAHHGKVRMGIRAQPTENPPDEVRFFARGVWDGDLLPPLRVNGIDMPETTLQLDIVRMGHSDMGPSWTARTHDLLEEYGPFRLAWLEALLRISDSRASATEEEG